MYLKTRWWGRRLICLKKQRAWAGTQEKSRVYDLWKKG